MEEEIVCESIDDCTKLATQVCPKCRRFFCDVHIHTQRMHPDVGRDAQDKEAV